MTEWYCRNFTPEEVRCPCCGVSRMNGRTMGKFQKARDHLGRPMYGTSWCRCARHNKIVGGELDSSHAFDFCKLSCAGDVTLVPLSRWRRMNSHELFILKDALREAGFRRLGIHNFYIHADDDPDKPQDVMWLY